MKKFAIALMFMISLVEIKLQAFDFTTNVELGVGYRRDKFRIESIPTADISIQRSWHDINAWTLYSEVEILTCNCWYFKAQGDYGWTDHGNEHYISIFDTPIVETLYDRSGRNGDLYDFEFAFGYEFSFCCHEWYFTPLIGWRWSGLNLKNGDLRTGDIINPNSGIDHHVRVNGFLVGFEAGWNFDCNWETYLGYEFSPLEYKNHFTEINTNAFDASYSQKSHNMTGNYLYLGTNYLLPWCGWYVGGQLDWRWNWAKHGNETNNLGASYQTSHCNWQSFGGELFVGYQF
jgi:hypothetical protein